MFACPRIPLAFLLTLLLMSCAAPRPAPATVAPRTWIVEDAAALAATFAPTALASVAAAPARLGADSVTNAVSDWMTLACETVAREYVSPPRAARGYALLAVGINDALLVADAARIRGLSVSDEAAIAAVASRVLSYNHPLLSDVFTKQAAKTYNVGPLQGQDTGEGVLIGATIGEAVAQAVIAWAQQDGGETFTDWSDPAPAPGVWQRTPPALASALEPGWGNVRPIGIASAQALIAPPPPAWDSTTFVADRAAFAQTQASLTDADRALAKQWAAGMGTMTPAGMWLDTTTKTISAHQLSPREAAPVYAAVAVAMHNGFIATWHSKFTYLVERPITSVQQQDAGWTPVVVTPPFPSYPSGHATISGAASTVLAALFPAEATQFEQDAESAAYSRIVGGIHWPLDSAAGLAQGQQVGQSVLALVQP